MRILFAGGGTGGHVYPALAIAKNILDKDPHSKILFMGTKQGLESKIVPKEGFEFRTIEVEGLERKLSLKVVKTGFKAVHGLVEAFNIIHKFNPQVVIGTGGYVCGPCVLAAKILRIPTVIHEQNALPGITNKFLGKFVDKILVTFPESKKYFKNNKVMLTGLPVREEILLKTKDEGAKYFNLDPNKKTILVTGGSRGAKNINKAMIDAYNTLLKIDNIQIIHITGERGYKNVVEKMNDKGINIEHNQNIILKPYLYNMEYALACADLCIARAGATFLAEMTAKGIPSILIPYPFASENHQEFNARSLVNRNASIMILDKELTGENLSENILKIIKNEELISSMSNNTKKAGNPDSLVKIANTILKIADH